MQILCHLRLTGVSFSMTALSVGTAEENVLCESLSELMLREMDRKLLVSCGFILV